MPTIQERIKERRLSCGFTLLEVADKLGVKEATVQRYESGEIKNVKHEKITSLANILNCSPAYLMGWTDVIREIHSTPAQVPSFTELNELNEFKEKLRYLREQNNLTLQDISEYVGVSKPTVQRWESGEIKNLKRDKIKLLSEVLNTTPAYLMGWADEKADIDRFSESEQNSSFTERLKLALGSVTSTELASQIGLSKQAISTYLTSTRTPKLPVVKSIAVALDVSEMWLMGYDVPKERREDAPSPDSDLSLSLLEIEIVKKYRSLDLRGQKAVLDTLNRECEFAGGTSAVNSSPTLIEDALHTIDNLAGVTATINQRQPTSKK